MPPPAEKPKPVRPIKPAVSLSKPVEPHHNKAALERTKKAPKQVDLLEKLKRQRERALKARDVKEAEKEKAEEEDAIFTPPVNQSGDGVNRLNAKYGY